MRGASLYSSQPPIAAQAECHVAGVDPGDRGYPPPIHPVEDWTPGRVQPGIKFHRTYKRSGPDRLRHSECLHLYER